MKTILSTIAIAGLFSLAACNTSALREKEAALSTQQQTIDSMKIELAKNRVIDSMNEINALRFSIPVTAPVVQSAAPAVRYVNRSSKRSYAGSSSRTTTPAYSQAPAAPVVYQPAPARKKGWSAKAKGAVIGAGTGAVAGAVINGRNRVAGAVIGGILGAGAGTGIGAILDKKNGR